MFINLLIVSREIRQNIEKSTYLPSCAHSLKSTSRFDLGYGDSQENVLLRPVEVEFNPVAKRKEEETPLVYDDDGIDDVWLEIYENSLKCQCTNCDCE